MHLNETDVLLRKIFIISPSFKSYVKNKGVRTEKHSSKLMEKANKYLKMLVAGFSDFFF